MNKSYLRFLRDACRRYDGDRVEAERFLRFATSLKGEPDVYSYAHGFGMECTGWVDLESLFWQGVDVKRLREHGLEPETILAEWSAELSDEDTLPALETVLERHGVDVRDVSFR